MRHRSLGALALATALLAGTTACSSNGGSASAGGGSGNDTVTVGAILSLSGTNSTLGPPEQKAMSMGVQALNKQGFTVGGKKYKFAVKYVDDKSDAATTGTTAFRQLVQSDKVPLVAIGLGTASYGPLLKRNPVPVINILDSTYPSVLRYDPHLFLLRADSPLYVPGCMYYAKTKLGVKSISVISPKGETYGEGLTELVQKSAPTYGMAVKTVAQYPLGASDYSSAITQVISGKPDAVYLSSVTAVQLPVLKQLRQAGYTGPVLHSSGVNPNQAKAILGADYNKLMKDNYDCAGTLPTTSSNPATKAFSKAYQSKFSEYPQDLTMWAYDFPFIVAAAMQKAGSTTDSEKIYKAIPQISVPKGTVSGWLTNSSGTLFQNRIAETASEVTAWCTNGKTIGSAMIFQVKNGQVVDPKLHDACAAG